MSGMLVYWYVPPDNLTIFVPPFSIVNRRKWRKWQFDDDSNDDDVTDTCSVESSDSDDNEETDVESSDEEDDDQVNHSKSDDDLFDSDGDIIQVRNLVYVVE